MTTYTLHPHSLIGRFVRRLGYVAITLGRHIFFADATLSGVTLRHERCHVAQWERLGWRFLPLYLWYTLRYGYRQNPLEVEARAAE